MIDRQGENESFDIDLREIAVLLYARKVLILSITFLVSAIAALVLLLLPNVYTSSAVLIPTQSQNGALGSLAGQYGGLADLAGISLPAMDEDNKADIAKQLMVSRFFIGNFIQNRDLMPSIMASKYWDFKTEKLYFDETLYLEDQQLWVRDVDPPLKPQPTLLEAHEEFLEAFSIYEDKKSGFITISIRHHSPIVASNVLAWLIEDVNGEIRKRDISDAETSIEYLKGQISDTSLAGLRAIFFKLVERHTEQKMLAETQPEYALKIIDPPYVAIEHTSPNRLLLLILSGGIGFFISICFAGFLGIRDKVD